MSSGPLNKSCQVAKHAPGVKICHAPGSFNSFNRHIIVKKSFLKP